MASVTGRVKVMASVRVRVKVMASVTGAPVGLLYGECQGWGCGEC